MSDYLVAYDIKDERIRGQVCQLLKNHSITHQKSAYECQLSPLQKKQLILDVNYVIEDDTFCLFVIKSSYWSHQSINRISIDDDWMYIG